jgi:hypothetical protein
MWTHPLAFSSALSGTSDPALQGNPFSLMFSMSATLQLVIHFYQSQVHLLYVIIMGSGPSDAVVQSRTDGSNLNPTEPDPGSVQGPKYL